MESDASVQWLRCMVGLLIGWVVATANGCRSGPHLASEDSLAYYDLVASQIEYPDVDVGARADVTQGLPPWTLRTEQEKVYQDLTLQEVERTALENSQVMRDIGGTVVRSPLAARTVFDPAIQEMDPRSGTEAALSAFDADLGTSLFLSRNQRVFNNLFFGGGNLRLEQHGGEHQIEVAKRSAAGTEFALRNRTIYDRNNSVANLFGSVYETNVEAEFRHPLAQGGGIAFNRIAGPNATPGNYNGVLVARIRTDISLADFEMAVRNLTYDVERTYWELYYAYRALDATVRGRDAALRIWQVVRGQMEKGIQDRQQEALARERYFAAQAAVENLLSGRADASGGGVFAVERRLRLLMGLPASDGALIRPSEEPMTVDVRFDWDDSLNYSLTRRVELRKQQWTIRQRELELAAARNFLRMRLDFVGLYRRHGFGDNLFGNDDTPLSSAWESVFSDSLDDWRIGFEVRTPIGNRIGHTAVHHAELQLARENAVYRNQELVVSHELSGALAELDRAYTVTRTNYNRKLAAWEQIDAFEKTESKGITSLEFLLDAIRSGAEADSAYYRSLADYSLALANVHLARGSLLSSHGVYLTEGAWTADAYRSASRWAHRFQRRGLPHAHTVPPPISRGAYPQPVPEPMDREELERIPPGEQPVENP